MKIVKTVATYTLLAPAFVFGAVAVTAFHATRKIVQKIYGWAE